MGLLDIIKNTIKQIDNTTIVPQNKASYNSEQILIPDWYISISFGKSTSISYDKAVALAKASPQYHEQVDNGNILHQAIYSSSKTDFLKYIMLYELVGNWKSTFVMINGSLIDRKIIGKLNYCYGDKCRTGKKDFCFGASYMTANPFGCHRLQISEMNNPWWSYYQKCGNKWVLDRQELKDRIDSFAEIYKLCPAFNYTNIMNSYNKLPDVVSDKQLQTLQNNAFHSLNR